MRISSRRLTAVLATGALLLAACGGGSDDDASKDLGDTADEQVETTQAEATTTVEETTTTEAETTTTVAETTTTVAEAPTLTGPADGVVFTDASQTYSMLISPAWQDASDVFPDGVQGWFTGNETDAFAENINIVTNDVPTGTPLDLAIDASVDQLSATFDNFSLIDSGVIPGTNHPELGFLEYTADQAGVTIRFAQTFGLWDGTLVVFTASTDAEGGEASIDAVLPYGLTIAPPLGS